MHERETHAPRQAAEGTVRGKGKLIPAARRGATAFDVMPLQPNAVVNRRLDTAAMPTRNFDR